MPGIRKFDDGAFIRAFQAIDWVIQDNAPLFLVVWVGSVPALLATTVIGLWSLSGVDRLTPDRCRGCLLSLRAVPDDGH
jgi:hypothetical protein